MDDGNGGFTVLGLRKLVVRLYFLEVGI